MKNPTEMEIKSLFTSTGIKFRDHGDYFMIRCPFHKGGREKTDSAVFYKTNFYFKCFACGEGMGFAKLYSRLKHEIWNNYETPHLLVENTPVPTLASVEPDLPYSIDEGRVTSVYENARALEYARSRFLSDKFIKEFNIQATDLCKLSCGQIWHHRLLIPIQFNGKPYSLEGRDYLRTQKPKCLYPHGCSTSICFNQTNLDKTKPLVVCEGTMDIPKIWDYFTKNVTCSFGINITEVQKEFLKDCQQIILFIDDDEAGRRSISFFDSFMNYDFKVAIVKGKDPGDATVEETEQALLNALPYGEFLVKESGIFDRKIFSLTG